VVLPSDSNAPTSYIYHGRFYTHPYQRCEIYLGDARAGNVPVLFSLLYACRQIYHEARVIPFSCNAWELHAYRTGRAYEKRHCGWLRWVDLYETEHDDTIKWISFEYPLWKLQAAPATHELWCAMSLLTGLKFVVKVDSLYGTSWNAISTFVDKSACTDMEEEGTATSAMQIVTPVEKSGPPTTREMLLRKHIAQGYTDVNVSKQRSIHPVFERF